MSSAQHFQAGVAAGYASQIVCHPLDVIRTAYQAEVTSSASMSVVEKVRSLSKRGLGTFYKGLLPPLIGQGVYKGIIFSVNSIAKEKLSGGFLGINAKLFASGTIAGTVNSFVVAPVELIRTRLIIHEGRHKLQLSSIMMQLVENGGVLGLWRGIIPTILRDGPGLGFYFLAYDQARNQLQKQQAPLGLGSPLSFPRKVFAASLAGAAFWIYALPVDTVKTLIEASSARGRVREGACRGDILQGMWSKGAMLRLLNAYPLAIVRGIPASVVTLLTHDAMLGILL